MTHVLRTETENIAILTFNRPEQLNTINSELLGELEMHLDDIENDHSQGVILTGSGKAFCAGSDLKENHNDVEAWLTRVHRCIHRLQNFQKPTVAAINGFALGGGLEFASACLFRTSVLTAKFSLPEIKLGLIPSYGGTQTLSQLIGENRALEMMLSGEMIDADKAYDYGLVNLLVSEERLLLKQTLSYMAQFSSHSRCAFNTIRKAIAEGARLPDDEAMAVEAKLSIELSDSDDASEGVNAFLEKRKPVWTHK